MRSIALAVCLALTACAGNGAVGTPSTVADRTTLDEKGGIAAEALYQASIIVGHNLVTAGKLTEAQRKTLDNQCYMALLAVRAAYNAGNATDYTAAVAHMSVVTAAIFGLVK